jgi:hypothetical protein
MKDPERLSRLYMFAMAKHQVDVLNFNIADHIEGNHPQRRPQTFIHREEDPDNDDSV